MGASRRPPNTFSVEGRHDGSDPPERACASNRRVFREMVLADCRDRPLSWIRRRDLVRFGESLGMDAFEVGLLIRAVEYECGHVRPAAMDDRPSRADLRMLARPIDWPLWVIASLALLTCLLVNVAVLAWRARP